MAVEALNMVDLPISYTNTLYKVFATPSTNQGTHLSGGNYAYGFAYTDSSIYVSHDYSYNNCTSTYYWMTIGY